MKKFLVLLLLVPMLLACNPQRRAARKIDKWLKEYPELAQRDTVVRLVTVPVPAVNQTHSLPFVYGEPVSVTEPTTGLTVVATVFDDGKADTVPSGQPEPEKPAGPFINLQMLRPEGIDTIGVPVPRYVLETQKEPALIRYAEAALGFVVGLLFGFILKRLR
jgi:hypothetical protein